MCTDLHQFKLTQPQYLPSNILENKIMVTLPTSLIEIFPLMILFWHLVCPAIQIKDFQGLLIAPNPAKV